MKRPHTTVVLAMSADGKIADKTRTAKRISSRSPARFSSKVDADHLEEQVSLADGVLFGAGTLRAYGTTRSVVNPDLIHARKQRQQPPQPVQIVVSASGNLDPSLRFFEQKIPRWLLTTTSGAERWRGQEEKFERILNMGSAIDWTEALQQLQDFGLQRLAVLGGGELVASLVSENLVDELWLTVCPVILGGVNAPTPVEGIGFSEKEARRLKLLNVKTVEHEIFLHYLIQLTVNSKQ